PVGRGAAQETPEPRTRDFRWPGPRNAKLPELTHGPPPQIGAANPGKRARLGSGSHERWLASCPWREMKEDNVCSGRTGWHGGGVDVVVDQAAVLAADQRGIVAA